MHVQNDAANFSFLNLIYYDNIRMTGQRRLIKRYLKQLDCFFFNLKAVDIQIYRPISKILIISKFYYLENWKTLVTSFLFL